MLETTIITFREGIEAFLIVAIMAAFLVKSGRRNLLKPLFAGIVTAIVLSATTGWHVAGLAENPLWEGGLAMTAGILVASFTVLVMKNARNIKGHIHDSLEKHAQETGWGAIIGVFIFTVLMIAREGMETALMLGAISAQNHASQMWLGAFVGLASVAVIGWLWVRQSHRINLKLFLQVTGIFLTLFAVHLFVYGVHELGEMSAIPFVGQDVNEWLHVRTEVVGHDSVYAQLITYSLIVVPTFWLILSFLRENVSFYREAYE